MDLEQKIPDFLDWFLTTLVIGFPVTLVLVTFAGCVVGFVVSATRRGPVEGFYAVAKVIATAVADVSQFSLRRTLAMTSLAIREAFRRRVLIAFAVFVVVMLLAGWYLDVKSDQPARLYLSFVLTTSNYLVLMLALFLSAFSLPTDFKSKTIYTIVTKPVRPLEIVLGRVLGFTIVGSVILAAMCVVSFFFVVRGLHHTHSVALTEAFDESAAAPGRTGWRGETSSDAHHNHTFEVRADGAGETNLYMGHRHLVDRVGDGPNAEFKIGPPSGMLQARVPKRGTLRYLDAAGNPGTGINVGEEWMYRSYITGGSLAAAIWTFDGMTPARYPDGFELELNLRVFRTVKGNIEKGVRGSIFLRNPDPTARISSSEEIPFTAKEFVIDKKFIPRHLKAMDEDGVVHDVDLFEDLVHDGEIEVWIRCSDVGMYYGMAEADVYILDAEAPFWWNFVKGYIGIWLQLVLVSTFGVMFSTFLSAPVAMMATLSTIVLGYQVEFIKGVASGEILGGGPIESLIRMLTQKNQMVDMDIGYTLTRIVRFFDLMFMQVMQLATNVVPNYEGFNTVAWIAYGYNVEAGLLAMNILKATAYFLVVSTVGYFFLKTREVAA